MSRADRTVQLACLAFALGALIACDDGTDDLGAADAGASDVANPDPDASGSNGTNGANPDAGAPDADASVAVPDATDPGPDATAPDADAAVELPPDFGQLFGSCVEDADCGAEGICRSAEEGFPGGYCTKPCDGFNDRTACEVRRGEFTVYHHCFDRGEEPAGTLTCEFNCLNGLDCGRDGYTCEVSVLPTGGLCIPVCSSDEQCRWGTFCNRYTGECQAEPAPDPRTVGLSVTGGPCNSNADCASGECFTAGTPQQPTGWAAGYCVGDCILPAGYNNNDFFFGDALPPGTCAGEQPVCIPRVTAAQSRQDHGICLQGCTDASDCRTGYECARRVGNKTFDVGFCRPGICGAGGTVTCPTGHTCVTVQTQNGTTRTCAPN